MISILSALTLLSLPLTAGPWNCTAVGDGNYGQQSVYGPSRPTQTEAERAALQSCLNMGLRNCYVQSCVQLPWRKPAPIAGRVI